MFEISLKTGVLLLNIITLSFILELISVSSQPQFLNLQNENNNSTYILGLLGGLITIMITMTKQLIFFEGLLRNSPKCFISITSFNPQNISMRQVHLFISFLLLAKLGLREVIFVRLHSQLLAELGLNAQSEYKTLNYYIILPFFEITHIEHLAHTVPHCNCNCKQLAAANNINLTLFKSLS